MAGLKVESVGVSQLLTLLKESSWLVPSFQRDFVWSEADVVGLVISVIEARPIGMATLWEQPDGSELTLESISIPDSAQPDAEPLARFSDVSPEQRPKKFYAILDGRQRCTALAMAFGGLRAKDGRRKFSGRYFLDVAAKDESSRVVYLRDQEINRRGFTSESVAIANGLFPLASYIEGEELFPQWMRYLQAIHNPANYQTGSMPSSEELGRRDAVLKAAFSGINKTLLAVYVVPQEYGLGDICEVFETLNTSGTKVSTVDLLHSWLYSDTANSDSPVLLREWIDELGQTEGAIGWASRSERPELIAQIVTACYLALDSQKEMPRQFGRRKVSTISSMKAGDLLATPPAFWREIIESKDQLASYLDGFQKTVAGGAFPMKDCPYPVSSAIFVALRWYMEHDARFKGHWTLVELRSLFRAFFWMNALTNRYDQGFLTQSASDLKNLKELLFQRAEHASFGSWAGAVGAKLPELIGRPLPSRDSLIDKLTDARPSGALGKSFALPLVASARTDLLEPSIELSFPTDLAVELHHIYPKDWCKNNSGGSLAEQLDPVRSGRNFRESTANLMPLSRESNLWWRAQVPSSALAQKHVTYARSGDVLDAAFISEDSFNLLMAPEPRPAEFWLKRAGDLADHMLRLTTIYS